MKSKIIIIIGIILTMVCCSSITTKPEPTPQLPFSNTINETENTELEEKKVIKHVCYHISHGYRTADIREIEINGHFYIVATTFAGGSDGGSSISIIHSESCPCKTKKDEKRN